MTVKAERLTTLNEGIEEATKTAKDVASNLNKLDHIGKPSIAKAPLARPTHTAAAFDTGSGRAFVDVSRFNKQSLQPSEIAPQLRQALPLKSLEAWRTTNCAEFNAVNQALKSGAKVENLVFAVVNVEKGTIAIPCNNCSIWIELLKIKHAKLP